MAESYWWGKYTGAVFLDLAKAFDTVDHAIVMVEVLWILRIKLWLATQLSFWPTAKSSYCFMVTYLIGAQCQ